MSKQSEAKERQGYTDKVEPKVCMTCESYKSDLIRSTSHIGDAYVEEKNKRCGIGGFAVKKMGGCSFWTQLW